MNFEMNISLGNILTILGIIGTLFIAQWRVSQFTYSLKNDVRELKTSLSTEIQKIQIIIDTQADKFTAFQQDTKAGIAGLEAMEKGCYVKRVVEKQEAKIEAMDKLQIELRAQLPLQLQAIRKDIEDLSLEIKGLRTDFANRRKTDSG